MKTFYKLAFKAQSIFLKYGAILFIAFAILELSGCGDGTGGGSVRPA